MKYSSFASFACLLLFLLSSCSKAYVSSIPDYPVYLELDLVFEDKDLIPVPAYKIYTPGNINQDVERTGFGGILVYHGLNSAGMDAFYAFDAACPYEASRTTTVSVSDDHLYAVCPQCGSRYELLNGIGNPVEGPGREQLKAYHVSRNGNKIYVQY
ncbi:MAG: (2Fe-2S)-binding protein [Tannerellaceae bacterium]|jgi:nitrite reductase/ring-hydroxylating ferredoxin subunit|nr:(2Fe-2S)-binding protein [Tannerellaceae bacterium]